VKNVGAGHVEAIAKARAEGGPFVSLDDFCERVEANGINKRVI
jgi:DNA polymerase-3 subunit alpha